MKAAQLLLLALFSGAAVAQGTDPCADAYNAEVSRIQREARQHDGSEKAKQRMARLAESQTRLAASRARQCQAERAAAPAPAGAAKGADAAAKPAATRPRTSAEGDRIEELCLAEAARRNKELDRRYLGRRLMQVEQVKFREEQARIKAHIPECTRRGRW